MALTGKEKQKALRERRSLAGLNRREYWLTDDEKTHIDNVLKLLRQASPDPAGKKRPARGGSNIQL